MTQAILIICTPYLFVGLDCGPYGPHGVLYDITGNTLSNMIYSVAFTVVPAHCLSDPKWAPGTKRNPYG